MLIYLTFIDNPKSREKFEKLYLVHRNKMMYIAMHILKNQYDAEDALHNTFIAVAKHIDSIGDINDFRTIVYLKKAVKNNSLNILKKNNKTIPFDDMETKVISKEEIQDRYCVNEDVARICSIIYSLNDTYRDVLCFHYLNNLSAKEISRLLERPYNTVRSQITRGRKILIKNFMEDK